MNVRCLVACLFTSLLVGSFAMPVCASVLGSVGQVYEIAEGDALKEMQQKAAQIDWEKYFSKAGEKASSYRPEQQVSLPRALQAETRLVDVSYTLETDVPLPDGSGVYPKGYVINPLEMVQFPETMVVLNGSDRDQVNWFKKSKYSTDPSVFVIITDGDFADLERELKRPIYFATSQIVEKFDIRVIPSVAKQSGKKMEIAEIDITPKKKL